MSILIDQTELTKRGKRIQRLLKIFTAKIPVTWETWSSTTDFKIATFSPGMKGSGNMTDWRFKIGQTSFVGSYFEVWSKNGTKWALSKAYLHIFSKAATPQDSPKEILALHCDPLEDIKSDLYFYKKGPHLHISLDNFSFKSAHIALNRCDLDRIFESEEKLFSALSLSMEMLKNQIIDQITD